MNEKHTTNKPINEEKTTGTSYIIQFYQEVQQLTHWLAIYQNILTELKHRHGYAETQTFKIEEIGEQHLQQLKTTIDSLRYYAIKANIQYNSIRQMDIKEKPEDLTKQYQKIKEEYIINFDNAQEYTTKLNEYLLKGIAKTILENNADIIDKLFTQFP